MNPHAHPTAPKPTCTHTLLLHMCTVLELTSSRAGHKREAWENSFLPTSMTTLFRVRPWDLWIVTAHARLRGSWRREDWPPDGNQQRWAQCRQGRWGQSSCQSGPSQQWAGLVDLLFCSRWLVQFPLLH